MHGLFLLTAVFGVGVTAVDLLGLLGDGGDHDGGADHGGAEPGGGADHGHDGGIDDAHGATGHGSVLSVLRKIRLAVYFCLGFGPTGLFAEYGGSSMLGALAWAVPVGLVTTVLARATMRFQQRTVDSTVHDDELLLAQGEVTVPLSHGDMGRVRVRLAQSVIERYALAEDREARFSRGDDVEIVRVSDECVFVRRAAGDGPI